MKIKLLFASAVMPFALSLSGCNSANIQSAVESAANSLVQSTLPQTRTSRTSSTAYSISDERIHPFKPTRTSRDFGTISQRTERNPQGLTLVKLVSVSQQDSGGEFKNGFVSLFQMSPEGWLSEKSTYAPKSGQPKAISSGRYYLKGADHAQDFYTSGEVSIKRGVTNLISIRVE